MMMKKVLLICALLLACFLLVPGIAGAQDFPGDPDETDTGVPFDGGTSLLVIAAIVYGVKSRVDKRKEQENKAGI